MVLDKTGTVTAGKPSVASIISTSELTEQTILSYAASIESGSEHPLAASILAAASAQQIQVNKVTQFAAVPGRGVTAQFEGKAIAFGNAALMSGLQIDYAAQQNQLDELARLGQTPMLLAADQKIIGIISVADPIKQDSAQAVVQLKHAGIRVIMLTGDNQIAAQAIAHQAGIDEVRAQVLPQDKANVVKELQAQGLVVGMVGDGINDAPALAQADIGMAIGTGTDVAIESADIVILQGLSLKVPEAIALSKATVINIQQNLFGAFIYNTLSIPVAAGLLYPVFGVLLSPMIAGAAMALSSVTVVSNANRLRWVNLGN